MRPGGSSDTGFETDSWSILAVCVFYCRHSVSSCLSGTIYRARVFAHHPTQSPESPVEQTFKLLGTFLNQELVLRSLPRTRMQLFHLWSWCCPGRRGCRQLGQPKTRRTSSWPGQGLRSIRNCTGKTRASVVGRRNKLKFWLHRPCREPQTPPRLPLGHLRPVTITPRPQNWTQLWRCWCSVGPLLLPSATFLLSYRRRPSCYTTDPRWTCCKPSQTQPTPNALHGKMCRGMLPLGAMWTRFLNREYL